MIEITEESVERTARIMGSSSAAAKALEDARERRERGQSVSFYKDRGVIIVSGQPKGV